MTSNERAAATLCRAQRPLLLLGPEPPQTVACALRIADRLGAAVLTTPDAKGFVDDARSSGVFSFGAPPAALAAAAAADTVLAVSDLSEFTSRLGAAFAAHTVIHVTEEVTDVGRNLSPAFGLVGSVEATLIELERLLLAQIEEPRAPWFRGEAAARRPEPPPAPRAGVIHPAAAIDAMQSALPSKVRLCFDVTSASLHANQRLKLKPSQRVFSSIERSACMGEALMASIGIRLASDCPTLALVGDWCYLMSPSELHFAVEQNLDRYVVLVWANGGGALVGAGVKQQRIAVPERSFRWGRPPKLAALARSLNARAVRVTTASELSRAVARGLRGKRPLLIEASIDPDVKVPAEDRFLSLGVGRG